MEYKETPNLCHRSPAICGDCVRVFVFGWPTKIV